MKPNFHPLSRSVYYSSRMYPSLPPIYNGLATGIDGAAFEEVLQGPAQLVTVAEVVVENPFFYIGPVLSSDHYDFHGNHPLSFKISDFGFRIKNNKKLIKD